MSTQNLVINKRPFGDWSGGKFLIWFVVLLVTLVIVGPTWLGKLRPQASAENLMIVDFYQEWASAKNAMHGIPVYADQEVTMWMYLGAERNPDEADFLTVNAHPPTSVLWALPFSYLDYANATLVWNLCSLALLALTLVMIFRELEIEFLPWGVLPLSVLLLVCEPLQSQIFQGQWNLVLLFLLTATWVAARRERLWLSGCCLGVAIATKLFPAYLLLYFLLRRQWSVLASTTITVVGLTAITIGVVGVSAYSVYITEVVPHVAGFRDSWYNISISGLWAKLFVDQAADVKQMYRVAWFDAPQLAAVLGIVSGLIVTGIWATVILARRRTGNFDLLYALGIVAMLLASPITWPHYLLMLALPILLAWLYLPKHPGYRAGFACLMVLFWILPTRYWDFVFYPNHKQGTAYPLHVVTALSIPTYALIVFYGWMIRLAWHRSTAVEMTEQTSQASEDEKSTATTEEVPQLV